MNYKPLIITLGLVVAGAILPHSAEALQPCSACRAEFHACIAAGGSEEYCLSQLHGSQGCPIYRNAEVSAMVVSNRQFSEKRTSAGSMKHRPSKLR